MSNYTGGVNNRRKRALKRLEVQLKGNQKAIENLAKNSANLTKKGQAEENRMADVITNQIHRQEKEIATLKTRIK